MQPLTCTQIDPKPLLRLFKSTIPERKDELRRLWSELGAELYQFSPARGYRMQVRAHMIEFDQKATALIWLLGFTSWDVFRTYADAIHEAAKTGAHLGETLKRVEKYDEAEARLKSLLMAPAALLESCDIESFQWPSEIPKPQADKAGFTVEQQAAFDIMMFATAYVFLHELRHVWQYRQGNKFAGPDKEIDCDVFARSILFDKVSRYREPSGAPYDKVMNKRAMGVALGAFIVLELAPISHRRGSSTHPPFADRLDALINNMPLAPDASFWNYISCLLLGALRRHSELVDRAVIGPKELAYSLMADLRRIG